MTICICTRNRPNELAATVASFTDSKTAIDALVISDDGHADDVVELITKCPLRAEMTFGPQRGLAANRNHAISRVRTNYVLFLDDDCALGPTFLQEAFGCLTHYEREFGEGMVIVTGRETKHGEMVSPSDQSFLGFQDRPYQSNVALNSIVINSTLFPTALVRRLGFDERLRYGSEEVEMSTRAVAAGATIVFCPAAVNLHVPSSLGRGEYDFDATVSRLYATIKRYAFTERKIVKALLFALVAPFHAIGAGLKADGFRGAIRSARAVGVAGRNITSLARERRGE